MKIDWDAVIHVDDGSVLVADVFRPNDDKQHPVLLAAGPYGRGLPFSVGYPHQWHELTTNHTDALVGSSNKYQVWEYPDPEVWVKQGYALVRVDTRGTGCSPGKIDFFSPRETRDLCGAFLSGRARHAAAPRRFARSRLPRLRSPRDRKPMETHRPGRRSLDTHRLDVMQQ